MSGVCLLSLSGQYSTLATVFVFIVAFGTLVLCWLYSPNDYWHTARISSRMSAESRFSIM